MGNYLGWQEQRRAHPAFDTEIRESSGATDQESDFSNPHLIYKLKAQIYHKNEF